MWRGEHAKGNRARERWTGGNEVGAERAKKPQVQRGDLGLEGLGRRKEESQTLPRNRGRRVKLILTQFRNCAAPAGRPAGLAWALGTRRRPEPCSRPAPVHGRAALRASFLGAPRTAPRTRERPRRVPPRTSPAGARWVRTPLAGLRECASARAAAALPEGAAPGTPAALAGRRARLGEEPGCGRGAGQRWAGAAELAAGSLPRPVSLGWGPGRGPDRAASGSAPRGAAVWARARGAVRGAPLGQALGLQPWLPVSPARASPPVCRRPERHCNGTGTPALHCGSFFKTAGSTVGPLGPLGPRLLQPRCLYACDTLPGHRGLQAGEPEWWDDRCLTDSHESKIFHSPGWLS